MGFLITCNWRVKSHFPLILKFCTPLSLIKKKTLPTFTSQGFMKPQLLGLFFIFLPFFFLPFPSIKLLCKVDDILIDDFGHQGEQFETLK
jgi:hypothetical protein